jgi:glutamate 5-kinase
LAAGVLGVRGAFASGQAVRILVRKKAAGVKNSDEDLETACEEYARGLAPTQPGTPLAAETETVGDASSESSAARQDLGPDETETPEGVLPQSPPPLAERDAVVDDGQWEVEEVGRGLANYNSAQVDKVKGLNRCVPRLIALRIIFSFPVLIA